MSEKPGGREGGQENVKALNEWVAEREQAGDWADYLRRGHLNRTEIARECSFALSCFRSNPGLKSTLMTLETRLREGGILSPSNANENGNGLVDSANQTPAESRTLRAKFQAEQRVKVLEEQNAALRAEVGDLLEQLRRFKHLEAHLCKTGRLLYP